MAAYAAADRTAGRAAADAAITLALTCPVPEITRLGRTLRGWRTEFLARFDQAEVSNGPTECLNLKVKNTKRVARGYRSFRNYRLRLLLNHGLIRDDQATTRICECRCGTPGRRTVRLGDGDPTWLNTDLAASACLRSDLPVVVAGTGLPTCWPDQKPVHVVGVTHHRYAVR